MDRPVWRTQKIRATDLEPGDVTRNSYGKWDEVKTSSIPSDQDQYVTVRFVCGAPMQVRTVHLVDVQVVKPS